jgi:chromosome segregation ATPase
MCKKFLIAGVAVALGLLVVRKTEVGSHLRAWWRDGKNLVQNSVPIPNEIERLKAEIERLDNVYRNQFDPVAREMQAVDKLTEEIAEIEKRLAKHKSDIHTMKTDLESGATKITYGDFTWPRERIEKELARRFDAYQTCEKGLEAKKDLLEAKKEKLASAMKKLEEMKNAKFLMMAEVDRLETDYANVVNAQEKTNLQIDDSDLSRIKSSLARLKDRIQFEKKKCELAGQFIDTKVKVTTEKVEKRDLIKEIDKYFGNSDVRISNNK